uniref:Uncharacterized protein n=1 Tax=Phyllosticta capitalensis polymycovirus 1 TaxID=3367395 RepID=A0AB74UJE1_9VIRU
MAPLSHISLSSIGDLVVPGRQSNDVGNWLDSLVEDEGDASAGEESVPPPDPQDAGTTYEEVAAPAVEDRQARGERCGAIPPHNSAAVPNGRRRMLAHASAPSERGSVVEGFAGRHEALVRDTGMRRVQDQTELSPRRVPTPGYAETLSPSESGSNLYVPRPRPMALRPRVNFCVDSPSTEGTEPTAIDTADRVPIAAGLPRPSDAQVYRKPRCETVIDGTRSTRMERASVPPTSEAPLVRPVMVGSAGDAGGAAQATPVAGAGPTPADSRPSRYRDAGCDPMTPRGSMEDVVRPAGTSTSGSRSTTDYKESRAAASSSSGAGRSHRVATSDTTATTNGGKEHSRSGGSTRIATKPVAVRKPVTTVPEGSATVNPVCNHRKHKQTVRPCTHVERSLFAIGVVMGKNEVMVTRSGERVLVRDRQVRRP